MVSSSDKLGAEMAESPCRPVPRHRRNPRRCYDEHGQEIAPPTVGDARAQGEITAAVYCDAVGCYHGGVISTDGLPADLPFPDIALRCRCSKCGSKEVRAVKDMAAHYERMRAAGLPMYGGGQKREKPRAG